MKQETYQQLYAELETYENSGIHIKLENYSASPMQVVSAHMVRETTNYMRDYEWDDKGRVKEVTFHIINES